MVDEQQLPEASPSVPTEAPAQTQPESQPASSPAQDLVNVVDPDTGELGSLPTSQLAAAVSQGYTPATPEQVQAHLDEQKYGGVGQGVKAFLEGMGQAATFGGSTALEKKLLGVKGEDILGREREHPIAHGAGQVTSLAVQSAVLPGLGEAGLLEKAGQAAAEGVGLGTLEGATTLQKVGSAAIKGAVETGLFQSGDETSKLIADPTLSVQTAALNVGLSGLLGAGIGGGIGAIPSAWKLAGESKTGKLLKVITDKLNGTGAEVPEDVLQAIQASGVDLSPEIRGRLIDDPLVQEYAKKLVQTDTTAAGVHYQNTFKENLKKLSDATIGALGKSADEVEALPEFSHYEAGKALGNTLADEVEKKVKPLTEAFEQIRSKYGEIELPETAQAQMSEKIANVIEQERWGISPSSDIMREANRVLKELPNLKTINDIDSYITRIGENTASNPLNGPLIRAGSLLKNVLKDSEAEIIGQRVSKATPELVGEYQSARNAWRVGSDLKEQLDARLHAKGSLGKYADSIRELAQTDGEGVLRKLSGKGDADLLQFLNQHFPETAQALRETHLNQLLDQAKSKAKLGEVADSGTLLKKIQGMSPELRSFVVSPESQTKLEAIDTLHAHLKDPNYNFSNTGRTTDALMSGLPGAAATAVTMLLSHNPLMAGAVGLMTRVLGKDAPDAAKLALLKFLGSSEKIDAEGFKAAFDFIHHTIEGQNRLGSAVKNVFHATNDVLPGHLIPKQKDRDQLQKKLDQYSENPEGLLDVGGKTGHYLPEQNQAVGQTAVKAVQTLKQMEPSEDKPAPLSPNRIPSYPEKRKYDRALDIAEQPLLLLKSLKEGTLTGRDVALVQNLYPELYSEMSGKLMDQLTTHLSRGKTVPYATKIGLSLFLGQPLDASLTPQSIQMNQGVLNSQVSSGQAQQAFQSQMKQAHSLKELGKLPAQYRTPEQARAMEKSQLG